MRRPNNFEKLAVIGILLLCIDPSSGLCNRCCLVCFLQGHPHHYREDQKSCVAVHARELDVRALAGPQVVVAESDRRLPVHDHLAGWDVLIFCRADWGDPVNPARRVVDNLISCSVAVM